MDFISQRVSVEERTDGISVVISARLTRGKEAMLVSWCIAWLLCGGYIAYEIAQMPHGEIRSFFLAFMAFWLWFAFRIGRVALWRLRGFELWRLKEDRLTIKDSIFGYGRANDYFVENIQGLGLITVDEADWKWQLNDSFWVMGGERLGFEYLGKKVAFGKGTTREEAQRAAHVLERALKKARKAAQ